MLSSLSTARHELFEVASANTNTLNTKLEEAVSTIPEDVKDGRRSTKGEEEEEDDGVEQDGDETKATAFFHREIGTQTSPHLSRATSSHSITSSQSPPQPQPSIIDIQTTQLISLQDKLQAFITPPQTDPPQDTISGTSASLKQELSTFQAYLNSLRQGSAVTDPTNKGPEDPIWSVRTELRLAKGALLSSRNFPAAGKARSGTG